MTDTASRCMIVEDDDDLAHIIETALEAAHIETSRFTSADEALERFETLQPHVIVLDVDLPGTGGHAAAHRFKEFDSHVGVLMLTGRDSEQERVESLSTVADDYLTKPCSIVEVAARVIALARRVRQGNAKPKRLHIDDVVVDVSNRVVIAGNVPLTLTKTEFNLLTELVTAHPFVISTATLIAGVWGCESRASRHTLNVHLHTLRKKLSSAQIDLAIKSERGFGFKIVETA